MFCKIYFSKYFLVFANDNNLPTATSCVYKEVGLRRPTFSHSCFLSDICFTILTYHSSPTLNELFKFAALLSIATSRVYKEVGLRAPTASSNLWNFPPPCHNNHHCPHHARCSTFERSNAK